MIKIANCNLLNEEAQKVYDEYDMANFIFKNTVNEIFKKVDFYYNRKYVLESIDKIQVS
ncbi:hypothetical protein IC216_14290 [Clostridioides sp. ES-S-0145-01]|uniref:hypothetical protein n=1 Tax=Clostridioides sp. ES-S-0145-01 TaxID=2770784 RepID=UPI001D0FDB7E|nr:hypothetical protein [Clostridioides sp. ES-S-0145-01]